MKYKIEKKFYFEAAHRLGCGYQGKCTSNHGHSWEITVSLQAEKLDSKGMVIDFAELGELGGWLMSALDHATILHKDDPFLSYLQENGHKVYTTTGNPTSEELCRIIMEKAIDLFQNKRVKVSRVCVAETCTARAELVNE